MGQQETPALQKKITEALRLRRRKPVEFGTAGQASTDEVRTRLQVRILPQALP
jgi:hypothetical protein